MKGQREAKSEEKSLGENRLPWIIAGAAAGVLAAVYIGTCAWAAGRQTILPNVSVAGVDVSNLTLEQAREAVSSAVDQAGGGIELTLDYEGISRTFRAAGLTVDSEQSVQDAFALGRGSFFAGGPRLVGHMLGMSSDIPLALGEEDPALDDFVLDMERAVADASEDKGYRIEDGRLVMTKGAPVAAVNWEQVRADARSAIQEAFGERLSGKADGASKKNITLTAEQGSMNDPDFEAIRREVYTEPKDASLNLETMEVTDHAVGVDFDLQALKAAYEKAAAGETFSVPLTVTQPRVAREDLEGSLFRDLLGEGTTRVSGSANRKHNVKLAASACNDKILLPGEEFSYNNTTGSRTAAKGYKEAPIYAGSRSDIGVGGGVCQPSSTIYFAVLHTNLEVVERHAHGFNTGYVEEGMDATVFFGVQDFRFKNSTDYPIKIVTSSYDSNGNRYLNVKIYGTNPEGVYAVPRSSKYNRVAPTTVYSPDPSVPRGTLVLDREQYAYVGISAHTYRDIYDGNGSLIETQDMGTSKYNMRPNTYFYNPDDGDPSTWENGVPPAPPSTDPGTETPEDPGTAETPPPEDPGTTETPPPEEPVTPPPSDSGISPIDPDGAVG